MDLAAVVQVDSKAAAVAALVELPELTAVVEAAVAVIDKTAGKGVIAV